MATAVSVVSRGACRVGLRRRRTSVAPASVAAGADSAGGSVIVIPWPGRRSVQVTSRSLPDPEISQLPLSRLVPWVPLASSMTTRPLLVWARTPPLSPPRLRLRLTAAMMSRCMDDPSCAGFADEPRPRPVAAHVLPGHVCHLYQRVGRSQRFLRRRQQGWHRCHMVRFPGRRLLPMGSLVRRRSSPLGRVRVAEDAALRKADALGCQRDGRPAPERGAARPMRGSDPRHQLPHGERRHRDSGDGVLPPPAATSTAPVPETAPPNSSGGVVPRLRGAGSAERYSHQCVRTPTSGGCISALRREASLAVGRQRDPHLPAHPVGGAQKDVVGRAKTHRRFIRAVPLELPLDYVRVLPHGRQGLLLLRRDDGGPGLSREGDRVHDEEAPRTIRHDEPDAFLGLCRRWGLECLARRQCLPSFALGARRSVPASRTLTGNTTMCMVAGV